MTRRCPRCQSQCDSIKDKSRSRWKWSKVRPATYVCTICEAELLAKARNVDVKYTVTMEGNPPPRGILIPKKTKKIRRTRKLCVQCGEVWFLIGLTVWPDQSRPLVCSKRCRREYRRIHGDNQTVASGASA